MRLKRKIRDAGHTTGIGSFGYMAPEQTKGAGRYDEKVDMYSLGTVLFDMWWNYQSLSIRTRNLAIK